MSLEVLSRTLWRERELLELLLFKLEEEQLVLATGRTRWMAHATREVEMVLAQIREAEVLRAAEVEAVAVRLGLGSAPSLRALSEAAPEPWRGLLASHRESFLALTSEISALAEDNRELVARGAAATREMLAGLSAGGAGEKLDTYGPGGRATAPSRPHLVDEAL